MSNVLCVFVQATEQPLAEEDQVRATLHRAPPCGEVLPQGGRLPQHIHLRVYLDQSLLYSGVCAVRPPLTYTILGMYLPSSHHHGSITPSLHKSVLSNFSSSKLVFFILLRMP